MFFYSLVAPGFEPGQVAQQRRVRKQVDLINAVQSNRHGLRAGIYAERILLGMLLFLFIKGNEWARHDLVKIPPNVVVFLLLKSHMNTACCDKVAVGTGFVRRYVSQS